MKGHRKVYRVTLAGGAFYYVANQADAQEVRKANPTATFERVDIPEAKDQFLDWLNEFAVAVEQPADPAARCPNCKRSHAEAARIAALADRSAIQTELETRIYSSDPDMLAALSAAVIVRIGELRKTTQ